MSSAESAGFVLLAGDPLVDSQFLRNSCSTSLACLLSDWIQFGRKKIVLVQDRSDPQCCHLSPIATSSSEQQLLSKMYFQQGRLTLGKLCIAPQKGHPRTSGMDLICTVPRPHLLGHALIWPGKFSATTFGLFGLYPLSLSKSAGFVSLAGKASLVSISDAILFYNLSMFIYRWSQNFVEKLCWKGSMTADMPSRASYLVYIEWRVNWSKLSQKPV